MRERKLDKYMEAVWGDYDSSDPVDKGLLYSGYFFLGVLLISAWV